MKSLVTLTGYWSAIVFTLSLIGLNAAAAVTYSSASAWQGIDAYAATFSPIEFVAQAIGLVFLPAFVVMIVSLHHKASGGRRILSHLGVVFGVSFATLVEALYFLQVAVVLPNLSRGETEHLGMIVFANPASAAWALNILGWGVFQGLATLFVGLGLDGDGLVRWVRRLLLLNGGLSFLVIPGYVLPYLALGSLFSWSAILPVVGILLTIIFRRSLRERG